MMTFVRILLTILTFSLAANALPKNSFLEKETPFLRSALVFKEGKQWHQVRRGIIVPLDAKGTWGCFDPDVLDWVVIWKGESGKPPLSYDSMASISYPNEFTKATRAPRLQGKVLFSNLTSASRKIRNESVESSRPDLLLPKGKVGPLSPTLGRFDGISLRGSEVVLHYRLDGTRVAEVLRRNQGGDFQRLLEVGPGKSALTFGLLIPDARVAGRGARLSRQEVIVAPSVGHQVFQIFDADSIPEVAFPQDAPATPAFPKSYSTKQLKAQVQAPFTVRDFALPDSPRTIRTTDIAFRADASAYIVTLDGDVWRVMDIESESPQWLRIATGIFEPMAIEVDRNDRLYVLGRDQITELIDQNGDGHIDLFRNASDIFQQTLHTRDYATSLAIDSENHFYIAKGGIHDPKVRDNELSAHRGTVLKISPDGDQVAVLADGLRLPYVGLRDDDTVFASDQQGVNVPSTPIHLITNTQPFLGFSPTNFRKQKEITEPLLWYPYQVNRSGASFATLSGEAFPDCGDAFLQVSWNGRLFAINAPENGRAFSWQLPVQFDFPSLNGATHPVSKRFYAIGLGISAYKPTTEKIIGIASLEQTLPFPAPEALTVTDNKIVINFRRPLAPDETVLPSAQSLRLFNIQRTDKYGSGHFLWDGKPGEHRLQPLSIELSQDRSTLTLDFEMIRRSDVFDLALDYTSGTDTFPIHLFTRLDALPVASQGDLKQLASEEAVTKLIAGDPRLGKPLFSQYACAGCHSLVGVPLVGPALDGVASRHEESYLRESILNPTAIITEGYEPAMPSFEGVIPEQELEHLLAYLGTLRDENAK